MKKLLHQRLREHRGAPLSFASGDANSIILSRREAQFIADEIERYYEPRPRFPDGEPVEWGSNEIEWEYGDEYSFNAIEKGGIAVSLDTNFIAGRAVMTDDGFVKRKKEKHPLGKMRDEMKLYEHENIPYSVLDGWVKDLNAYIDQQGKDE